MFEGGNTSIYEVKPCKIVERNDEVENLIFNTYLYASKIINFDYKIIIKTDKIQFKDIKDILENNKYVSNNSKQKEVIEMYEKYLTSFSNEINYYERRIYLIVKNMTSDKEVQLQEMIKILMNIGINVNRIKDETLLYKILYESINRVKEEM